MTLVTVIVATALLLASAADAGQPPAASVPATVDFLAVSRDGAPTTDLKSDEITLRIDGRPRRLRSLEWVGVAPPPARGGDAPRETLLPPPFGSNRLDDAGRTVILVLDDDSFRPGREGPLREALAQFLNSLSSRDRVALVTVPYGGLKVNFTTDHSRVTVAMSSIVGQAPEQQTGSELACRTRRTLESLTGLLGSLGGGERPSALVFFSSGLAGPRRDAVAALAPGMCELTTDHFEQVGVAASLARSYFYVVQPEDVDVRASRSVENIAGAGFTGSDDPRAGLEHLTGVTGGYQLPMRTTRENNLIKLAAETAGYYLLTFETEASDRNGARHQVDVRTSRENVIVRVRPTITIPRSNQKPTTSRLSPRDMLRESRAFRDLPLRAIGYPSQNAPGDKTVKILTAVEPTEPDVKLTAAAAGLFDGKGRLMAQWTANADDLAATPVIAALVVPPGVYRLRLAAVDATGRSGSADYEMEGELTPIGPLSLSGLVLGLSRSGSFAPRMQFGAEPVAIAYLEIYGDPGGAAIGVTMELTLSATGAPLLAIPAAVQATSDKARHIVTAAIPVGGTPSRRCAGPRSGHHRWTISSGDQDVAQDAVAHTHCGLWTVDCGLWTEDCCGLRTGD